MDYFQQGETKLLTFQIPVVQEHRPQRNRSGPVKPITDQSYIVAAAYRYLRLTTATDKGAVLKSKSSNCIST